MVRVLHVLGGLGAGGTESLIMNWYRNIDRTKVQFDFLVRSNDNNYVEEITALGGRIFYTSSFPRRFIKNKQETEAILRRKEWDIIHVHGNAAMYMLPLRLAKQLGYPCRIMHSHSVTAQNKIFSFVHYFNRPSISKYATCCLACSEAAGHWMYGDEDFSVLKNAVDMSKYRFCTETRTAYRKNLQLEDNFVVGHVGRFAMPKNHKFLLDVFAEIKKKQSNSKLLLVGDGELKADIECKAKLLGIEKDILFMGRRSDVGAIMSAMDIFVLPSLFEGMPVVCVECCANELPAIISEEAHTKEVNDLPNLHIFSLKNSPADWADFILGISCNVNKRGTLRMTDRCGYNVSAVVNELQSLYLGQ